MSDNWSLPYVTPHVGDPSISDLTDLFDFSHPTPPKGRMILTTRTCPSLSPAEAKLVQTEDPD